MSVEQTWLAPLLSRTGEAPARMLSMRSTARQLTRTATQHHDCGTEWTGNSHEELIVVQ